LHEGKTRIDVERIFSSGAFPERFATMHAYELKTLNSVLETAEGYNIAYQKYGRTAATWKVYDYLHVTKTVDILEFEVSSSVVPEAAKSSLNNAIM